MRIVQGKGCVTRGVHRSHDDLLSGSMISCGSAVSHTYQFRAAAALSVGVLLTWTTLRLFLCTWVMVVVNGPILFT